MKRSIECFKSQTHQNKELIIIYEESDEKTKLFLSGERRADIIPIKINQDIKLTLGQKRNLSIENATGDYFCQWDDDDWYHNKRLEIQISAISFSHKSACVLAKTVLYDSKNDKSYISDYAMLEGSILCKKDLYYGGYSYINTNIGEDTPFLHSLINAGLVYPILAPTLYIYRYHGENTWGEDHFYSLFSSKGTQALDEESNAIIKKVLNGEYSSSEASAILSSKKILGLINY